MQNISRRLFLTGASAVCGLTAMSLLPKNIQAQTQMSALDAIMTRRSVRSFTDEAVSNEQIEIILKAAMQAPSAGNRQPWEFVVVTDKELIKGTKTSGIAKTKATETAPLAILLCFDDNKEKFDDTALEDMGTAGQNILLSAHAIGLGAVWTNVGVDNDENQKAWQKYFKLPEHIKPSAFILIGTPKANPKPKNNFNPEKIHNNYWNN